MARPVNGDTSHRPVKKQCEHCGVVVLKGASTTYKKAFCSKEHMIAYMKARAFNFPCAICSTPIFTQPAQVRLRCRSTCSIGCRSKLARQRAEEKRHGYTKHQLDRLARYSVEAAKWRKAVFERDDYSCQVCRVRGGYLEADHIKPWAYFPDLRFELSNGRTLCRPCHDKTKMSAKRMREIYGLKPPVDNILKETP